MSVEYLLVNFTEDRDVLADGDRVGVTNHTLLLPAGCYDISLGGAACSPPQTSITLDGTSVVRPMVVMFS